MDSRISLFKPPTNVRGTLMTNWTIEMNTQIRIGIDIGWSENQRSSGVAILGATPDATVLRMKNYSSYLCEDSTSIHCFLFRHTELLEFLTEFRLKCGAKLNEAIVVIDGPIGNKGKPTANRQVDSGFRRGTYRNRMQPVDIESKDGPVFVDATYRVIAALGVDKQRLVPWKNSPNSENIQVAETNPTVGLALLSAPQPCDPGQLPTRKRPLEVDGKKYRAKSDWYWSIGGASVVATILRSPSVRRETHHERQASLYCLATAESIANSEAVSVGDDSGIYAFPNGISEGWQKPIQGIGIVAGELHSVEVSEIPEKFLHPKVQAAVNHNDGKKKPDHTAGDNPKGDEVDLYLTDNGGVHETVNEWLSTLNGPIKLHSLDEHQETIELSESPKNPSMWIVRPTAHTLAKRRGFADGHLKKDRFIVISVRIQSVGP